MPGPAEALRYDLPAVVSGPVALGRIAADLGDAIESVDINPFVALANPLSAEIAEGLQQPELAKRLQDASLEAIAGAPAEMASFMKRESERWGNVIRVTGTKAE